MPCAGNIAKTMTSNRKQFTVTCEMLTAVVRDQRWPDVVAGISARFSNFAFALFCYVTNHLMTGSLGNSELCFPRISMFPSTISRETKFAVPPLLSVRKNWFLWVLKARSSNNNNNNNKKIITTTIIITTITIIIIIIIQKREKINIYQKHFWGKNNVSYAEQKEIHLGSINVSGTMCLHLPEHLVTRCAISCACVTVVSIIKT